MSNSLATPWTVAHQAPLSMGLSRQEYWSGVPCPPPGDLPNPGIELWSSALQGVLYHHHRLGSHQRVICINPGLPAGLYTQCSPHNPDPPCSGAARGLDAAQRTQGQVVGGGASGGLGRGPALGRRRFSLRAPSHPGRLTQGWHSSPRTTRGRGD